MSLQFADSFDYLNTADLTRKWTSQTVANTGGTPAIGAFGNNATNGLRINLVGGALGSGSWEYLSRTIGSASPKCIYGFVYKPSTLLGLITGRWPIALISTATGGVQLVLLYNNDGTLSIGRNFQFPSGPVAILCTTSIPVPTGVWTAIEWGGTIDPAAGSCFIYINGVLAASASGVNTSGDGTTSWSQILMGFTNLAAVNWTSGAGTVTWDYDDLYVCDGAGGVNNVQPIGPLRVISLTAVAGNGVHVDSTPNPGTDRGANVADNPPDDDTTYNALANTGNADTYKIQTLTVPGIIVGVQVHHHSRVDAGGHTLRTLFSIGGVDYEDGATNAATASYQDVLSEHDKNPATGVAWTFADLTSPTFQVGPKLKS